MKPRVLILCTGNSCRSRTAVPVLNYMANKRAHRRKSGESASIH
jgi:protein-tyrosine-phosphatase